MTTFTIIMLALGILAGLIGVFSGLKAGKAALAPGSPQSVYARKHLLRGAYLMLVASLGLGLLLTGIFGGVEILFSVSLALALFELTVVRVKPNGT